MTTNKDIESANVKCGRRYRVWITEDMKWSGTRHCVKRRGHKGKCGKTEKVKGNSND